jgi:uncharacterized protein involved in response to NO
MSSVMPMVSGASERPAQGVPATRLALFSYGFRPFFLGGTIYAAAIAVFWVPHYFGAYTIPTSFNPVDWHAHEMLYGYLAAVITGFLLTAIPNWTGRLPLRGAPLILLVITWLLGRVAINVSLWIGPIGTAVIDLSFLVVVFAVAAREIVVGKNWKNLPLLAVLTILIAGNVLFHLEAYRPGSAEIGRKIGIAAAIALITLVGGRIIPSFTRNWLARENPGRLPCPFGTFDKATITVSSCALIFWVIAPAFRFTATLMLTAGLLHTIRLLRWAGDRTWRDRLVLIMHIGYGFVAVGFILLSGAALLPQTVPISAGIHAWTIGAIGTMTLAVMTRATLGHTGGKLAADGMTHLIFGAILVAALTRICAAFEPAHMELLIYASGIAWTAAFLAFAVNYGRALMRPAER